MTAVSADPALSGVGCSFSVNSRVSHEPGEGHTPHPFHWMLSADWVLSWLSGSAAT